MAAPPTAQQLPSLHHLLDMASLPPIVRPPTDVDTAFATPIDYQIPHTFAHQPFMPPTLPPSLSPLPAPSADDTAVNDIVQDPDESAPPHAPSGDSEHEDGSQGSESEGEDSEEDEAEEQASRWRPLQEDLTKPCEDEMLYIASKEEHSAIDPAYWQKLVFFDTEDEELKPGEDGCIDWLVEHFNGTQEEPNHSVMLRSPIVSIGGYDWCIKLYPRGNGTEFISAYIECVTMQASDYEEFEDFAEPPFPFLAGHDDAKVKKRRSVAAQVALVMYNPAEPTVHECKSDAHQFCKSNADYGWRYYSQEQRDSFHVRKHGQRQAIIRDDKLAFKAYVRVVQDPTGCVWEHDNHDTFSNSLHTAGLRPFAHQMPHIAAFVPLFHFAPFRKLLTTSAPSPTIDRLQVFLQKFYLRKESRSYGVPESDHDSSDVIAYMQTISKDLQRECGANAIVPLIGDIDPTSAAVGTHRLATKTFPSIQSAVDALASPISTPALLTLELERQEFNRKKRKWTKLTNEVELSPKLDVSGVAYTLFAFTTHCGELYSNRHNSYVNPGGPGKLWYAYEDSCVTPMTRKKAVDGRSGCDKKVKRKVRSAESFGNDHDAAANEVAYAVFYVRDDVAEEVFTLVREETWELPRAAQPKAQVPAGEDQELNEKTKQDTATSRPLPVGQVLRDAELALGEVDSDGSSTPNWPLMDGEDVIMSDAEDEESVQGDGDGANDMAASSLFSQVNTTNAPASSVSLATVDGIGQDYYHGGMLNRRYHGEGHVITMAGDEYTGTFINGKYSGQGTMTYGASGNIYEGEWRDGQHHGHGKLTELSTGNVYEGGFQAGRKHGDFLLRGKVTEEDRGCCTICYDKEIGTAFYDCGHVIACKLCAAKIDVCPICRKRVLARLDIYGVKMTLE